MANWQRNIWNYYHFIEPIKQNVLDARALQHLEDLLKRQPQLWQEHPEMLKYLEDCSNATAFADRIIR